MIEISKNKYKEVFNVEDFDKLTRIPEDIADDEPSIDTKSK